MTEPTPMPAGAPAPPAPAPAKKKRGPLTIIGIVVVVLAILGVAAYKFVLPAIAESQFKVGACINYYPPSDTPTTTNQQISVVDCSSGDAKAKIIAVLDGKTLNDADASCPANWEAAAESDKGLLCLVAA
ncbi:MAG TPA: hypothetical protein VH561_14730 [Micromonosporaceae bacterium]|jgi:hypothetical protein